MHARIIRKNLLLELKLWMFYQTMVTVFSSSFNLGVNLNVRDNNLQN